MTDKTKVKLQEWWMSELRKLTEKVTEQESKRQEKAKARGAEVLSDYASVDEIRDAYGYGFITEKKCEKLIELWEEANSSGNELYEAKIELLQDAYQEAKRILEGLKGE